MGMPHIHGLNAVKTVVAALINLVATLWFNFARRIEWHGPRAAIMTAGAAPWDNSSDRNSHSRSHEPPYAGSSPPSRGFRISAILFWRQFA